MDRNKVKRNKMYLNDFRRDVVLEVLQEIKDSDIKDLVYNVSIDENSCKVCYLSYDSMLHKISAHPFNPTMQPLYPNPDIKTVLIPRNHFVKNIKPDSDYYKLIEGSN